MIYHLVMTNIAMENPQNKWRFLAGKIIYKLVIFHGCVSHNQRVTMKKLGCHGCDGFEKNHGIGLREKDFHRKLHIFQGLVTVPFWEYWTSPYSSHYRL